MRLSSKVHGKFDRFDSIVSITGQDRPTPVREQSKKNLDSGCLLRIGTCGMRPALSQKTSKFNERIRRFAIKIKWFIHLLRTRGANSRMHWRRGGDLMKTNETELEKPSFWQLVFSQSKVNGALYMGEQLPGRNWNWPKNTYLQRRLRQVRWYQASEKIQLN
jgi:hypothetical protein